MNIAVICFGDSLSGFLLVKNCVVELFELVKVRSDLLVEEKRSSELSLEVDKELRLFTFTFAPLKRRRHLENLKLDHGLFENRRDLCLRLLGLLVSCRFLSLEPQVDLPFALELHPEERVGLFDVLGLIRL